MKKLLLTTAVFIGFWILAREFFQNRATNSEFDKHLTETSTVADQDLQRVIKAINEKNRLVNTLVASMPIRLRNSGLGFRLSGSLAFEKPRNLRLLISHRITGKEMDIGSNRDIFWFWSKRISPPALYFSRHENIYKTNLKSALNPILMMDSLNINEIDLRGLRNPRTSSEVLSFTEDRTSPSSERLELTTFVEKSSSRIICKVLSYVGGEKIVTTTYSTNLITYDYHTENTMMEWDMSGARYNSPVSASAWEMPNMTRTIDIGDE